MDANELTSVFRIGETIAVEFKRCGNGIESDVYETVCSFLNRYGGDIFLGVLDDGTVAGVAEKAAPDMVRNFISQISNPDILSPTVCLTPKIIMHEGKTLIHIHILPSAEVHSYKRVIYDRIQDADVKVTATAQIAQMYIRKQEIFTERKIYPYVSIEDLRLDLLPKLRTMAVNSGGGQHPWTAMTDEELLKSARLYGKDRVTGAEGYNLAAVMLLGRDDVIPDVVPAYLTDALLRRVDTKRYDDREIIRTNLIESYERLMAFAQKYLPDKFYLEDDQRKSLRTIITREIIANTLIHREYTSSYQAKFVIERSRMYVENANRCAQLGVLTPMNLEPNPKNPIIAAFFRNIGYADQLGSGVRNLYHYSKFYSGEAPELREDDIFRITVPLDVALVDAMENPTQGRENPTQGRENPTQGRENPTQGRENPTQDQGNPTQDQGNPTQDRENPTQEIPHPIEHSILELVASEPSLSQREIANRLNQNTNTIKYRIRRLKEKGLLIHIGSTQKGEWVRTPPIL